MSVIAVVNRKGGSGKSTLATHLAAWLAGQGMPTVLGDVDRQQSTHGWLRRRAQQPGVQRLRLVGWNVDPRSVVRPPTNSGHMVLDTPGGLRGFDLARVVMYADAILMPVCNSAFDRESATDCVAELRTLPRVASGRCRLAVVGMRIDGRTRAEPALRAWAEAQQVTYLGVLRDAQAYVRCIEDGLTLFDLPPAKVAPDMAQWRPILDWLAPLVQPEVKQVDAGVPASLAAAPRAERVPALGAAAAPSRVAPVPARESPRARPAAVLPATTAPTITAPTVTAAATDAALATSTGAPARARPAAAVTGGRPRPATPVSRLLDALAIPRFLQRNSRAVRTAPGQAVERGAVVRD
jgi:chromosome partitioning protein